MTWLDHIIKDLVEIHLMKYMVQEGIYREVGLHYKNIGFGDEGFDDDTIFIAKGPQNYRNKLLFTRKVNGLFCDDINFVVKVVPKTISTFISN